MDVMPNNQGDATENLNRLSAFRQDVYDRLGHARDALFELSDAVLLSGRLNITSLAALSLLPVFRRKWPSAYEALQDGRPDREALFGLYAHLPTRRRLGWRTAAMVYIHKESVERGSSANRCNTVMSRAADTMSAHTGWRQYS